MSFITTFNKISSFTCPFECISLIECIHSLFATMIFIHFLSWDPSTLSLPHYSQWMTFPHLSLTDFNPPNGTPPPSCHMSLQHLCRYSILPSHYSGTIASTSQGKTTLHVSWSLSSSLHVTCLLQNIDYSSPFFYTIHFFLSPGPFFFFQLPVSFLFPRSWIQLTPAGQCSKLLKPNALGSTTLIFVNARMHIPRTAN